MDEYTVKITSQAEEHLQKITRYITHELKAPEAALYLLDSLESSFASLKHFPQRTALTEYEPWRTNGVHFIPVKNFLVYFWIDEINLNVQIFAVIYAKRDQLHQLSQMDLE